MISTGPLLALRQPALHQSSKTAPRFQSSDDEDEYFYTHHIPKNRLGFYRQYFAPYQPEAHLVLQELDERRAKNQPKTHIALRTLWKGLKRIINTMPLATVMSSVLLKMTDRNSLTNAPSYWNNSTNIMAASSQKHISTKYKGYTSALFDHLDKPTSGSLGESQSHLEQVGYRNYFQLKQYPLSSSNLPQVFTLDPESPEGWQLKPNHCLNTWNKGEHPEKKFVILVAGDSNLPWLMDDHFEIKQIKKVQKALQKHYLLATDHIKPIENASSKNLKEALQQVTQQIQKEKIKGAEILIYYSGHGGTEQGLFPYFFFPALDTSSEGEAKGRILLTDGCLSRIQPQNTAGRPFPRH